MYFKSLITVEPSELSHIKRRMPTKAFGKLAHYLTLGLSSPKEVRQTFTAISILQSLNLTLHAIGVDNIVRLSKDHLDFYHDVDGIQQDLRHCMEAFEHEIDARENELFEQLSLVLEHHEAGMTFLIQVNILRNHEVGAHPIEIHVQGFSNEFPLTDAGEADARTRLGAVFAKQAIYDAFLVRLRGRFDQFLGGIVMALHQHMEVNAVQHQTFRKLIRRGDGARSSLSNRQAPQDNEPAFENFHGIQPLFWHAWVWSDLCHEHQIICIDLGIVDETGSDLGAIGTTGFTAGVTKRRRNSSSNYASDTGGGGDSGFGIDLGSSTRRTSEGSGWFDTLFGDGGWFSDAGDGGSGCGSSCGSSCGGGCGGGCGS